MEFSIFSNMIFFLRMYFFRRLMDCNNPFIDELREIILVSFEIFELISITTPPPLASKYSPSRVTAL